jgi:hypothetical protein
MTTIQFLKKTLTLLIGALFLQSCAAFFSGYEDGKTLGTNGLECYGSVNFSNLPIFATKIGIIPPTFENEIKAKNLAVFDCGFRYGLTKRIDLNARVNSNLNTSLGFKSQLIGDQQSKVALSMGLNFGNFGNFSIFTPIWNLQVPVSFSIHPSENLTWYFSPRYVYHFSNNVSPINGSFFGSNTGMLFGKKNKIGIDFGYYLYTGVDIKLISFTFGIGGSISLYDSKNDD